MFSHRAKPGKKAGPAWEELELLPSGTCRRFSCPRPNLLESLVIAGIVGVLAALLIPGPNFDHTHRYPPPRPIAGGGFAAVAGDYHQGSSRGGGRNLSILPDGRYSFVSLGCTGVSGRESGFLSRCGEHLILTSMEPMERRIGRVFLPIRWGRRSYLVETEKLQDFCDAIVGGVEPRIEAAGKFFLAGLDIQVDGTPELPEPWAAYLRSNLVLATVVEVMADGRARIDAGTADGLRVGSILTVRGRGRLLAGQLKVIAANRDSCEVEWIDPDESKEQIGLGWKVVSGRDIAARSDP